MLWWGCGLVVLGAVLGARAMWTARRSTPTGAHGLLIAIGVSLVVWGGVLVVVGAVLRG